MVLCGQLCKDIPVITFPFFTPHSSVLPSKRCPFLIEPEKGAFANYLSAKLKTSSKVKHTNKNSYRMETILVLLPYLVPLASLLLHLLFRYRMARMLNNNRDVKSVKLTFLHCEFEKFAPGNLDNSVTHRERITQGNEN